MSYCMFNMEKVHDVLTTVLPPTGWSSLRSQVHKPSENAEVQRNCRQTFGESIKYWMHLRSFTALSLGKSSATLLLSDN